MAAAGHDGQIRILSVETGQERQLLRAGTGSLRGMAFSPDGRKLAAIASDDRLRVRDLADTSP